MKITKEEMCAGFMINSYIKWCKNHCLNPCFLMKTFAAYEDVALRREMKFGLYCFATFPNGDRLVNAMDWKASNGVDITQVITLCNVFAKKIEDCGGFFTEIPIKENVKEEEYLPCLIDKSIVGYIPQRDISVYIEKT